MSETTFADAPTRAAGSIVVSWGLVPVPMSLFTATEEPTLIERHTYTADGHPVGQKFYDKETGEDVDKDTTFLAVEHAGAKVPLSDEEIVIVTAEHAVSRTGLEIEALIPIAEIGERYPITKLYQARPAGTKKEPNPAAAKAYKLLMTVLAEQGLAALVKFAIRGTTPRYAALCPDGTLRFLFFDDEIRAARDLADVEVSDRELDMARQLIGVYDVGTPELLNPARELLVAYVASKAAGAKAVEAPNVDAPAAAAGADLIAQLEASVAAAKAAPPPRKARPAKRGARTPSKKKAEEAA